VSGDRVEERAEFLLKAIALARERWSEYARAVWEGRKAERALRLAEGSFEMVARFSVLETEVAVADWRLEKPCLYLRERLIREEPEPLALVERVLRWLKGEGEDPSRFRELAEG
jgi:hypothetical protein